jgi:hypothetical protein
MTSSRAEGAGKIRRRRNLMRRRALLVVGPLLLTIMLIAAWIGTRAFIAKGDLEAAVPLVSQLQQQLTKNDGAAAKVSADQLLDHTSSAAGLTSDPVWKVAELVPWLGPNLIATSELAAAVNDVAGGVVEPLATVASGMSLGDFKPVDGTLKLQPLIDAQPVVQTAATSLESATARVGAIDTTQTFGAVRDATAKLGGMLDKASVELESLNRAVKLIPLMLGSSGPRNYLLMFQNPAELRAAGGIPGALAILHTENGRIQLGTQSSGSSFGQFPTPVLPLSTETRGLYGEITGRYMQDVTLTPNFAVSAELAREMWRLKYGVQVDGVISVDPITLSYLLKATGPVALPSGDTISEQNAVELLLTDAYERFPTSSDKSVKDAFFAATAATVFHAIASGRGDPVELVKGLIRAGNERRILVWSSEPNEQLLLSNTTLAGGLPQSSNDLANFGIYLNDGTGAKMGGFLHSQITLGQVTCRKDARPEYEVTLTLSSSAPADAATTLTPYTTGAGAFGVPAGTIRTVISVLGAPTMLNMGMTRDGAVTAFHPTTLDGYPVSAISVDLAPGAQTVLSFRWLGDKPFSGKLGAEITPQININVIKQVELTCGTDIE